MPKEMEIPEGEITSDWIFQQLSEAIIEGLLKSGEKISEPVIARRFGTSRAPVREAVRRLEERGLVNRKPRSGCRVASFSVESFIEICEIREALEGTACRLAAERMSGEELVELRNALEQNLRIFRPAEKSTAETFKSDMDFHYVIARGSKNATLARLLCEDYYNLIKLYRKRYSWIGSAEDRAQSIKEHLRILEAMEDRDGAFAEVIMRRHIAMAMKKLRKSVDTITIEQSA